MATLLTAGAVLALAVSPNCGAAKPNSDFARRLVATAHAESGLDPYAININGPNGGARHYASEVDAIVAAKELDAAHIDYDAGLLQINRRNFSRHGLTLSLGSAFDACTNMRAGADHLADDVRSVWNLASRRYNCGGTDCGVAYAQRVDALVARDTGTVQITDVLPPSDKLAAGTPDVGAEGQQPPPSWDVWGTEIWRRQRAGADKPLEDK